MIEPRWLTKEQRAQLKAEYPHSKHGYLIFEHCEAADARIAALERITAAAEALARNGMEYNGTHYVVVNNGLELWRELHDALRAAGRGGA